MVKNRLSEIKRMADLLKSGAVMLSESCPVCNTPLFKFKGEIFCAKCDKPVAIVKGPKDEEALKANQTLTLLEQNLLKKIWEANIALQDENDPEKLLNLTEIISNWLSILEKIKKIKSE
jgi:UPF0148 protein